MTRTIILASMLALAGCTAVRVDPLAQAPTSMCLQHNPKVRVDDFVQVLQQGFRRHGIETRLYEGALPHAECAYLVTYNARRSWDMAPYLSWAEVRVLGPRREELASAQYHLRGKGGLSMMKWQGTEAKMGPVIDQLLVNVEHPPALSVSHAQAQAPATGMSAAGDYEQRLEALRRESLSYEQYQMRYRDLQVEFGRQ